jgi:hypothetical protein
VCFSVCVRSSNKKGGEVELLRSAVQHGILVTAVSMKREAEKRNKISLFPTEMES